MNERRAKRRSLCSDIVELFWSDRLGWPHRAKAVLEDISPTGACLQVETLIPMNTELAVRLGEIGLPGIVKYCTLIGGSYFVGVEFAAGTRWEEEEYTPKHIFQWPEPHWTEPADERVTLELSESLNHGSTG